MATIEEIWRYPVKSMAGERVQSCLAGENGLEGDRRWALVDGAPNRAGKLLTIRQHERLMTYRARLVGQGVEVTTPGGAVRPLDDRLIAELAAESGRPLQLRDHPGANFDDSPVLVVNLASVRAFSAEVGQPVDHRRFRANVYVDGLEPEEELEWLGRRIRAGAAELEAVLRCERCVVITRDPDTTASSPELLRRLTETHATCMGVYCRVTRPGRLAVGDLLGL
ncbi:MAG TPA: MOSC N-terminal beta barrel domain-containing protein [Candidatus Dormibacteraeota bacterium]|nr:MOSC N-terminal beta barrel domain-containing protein [Candidatus Dormibacteraeota bacterium]